jgi:NAD(P)H-dependent flavin oxidoreductase YrpB (nitropropane dioxygenase family)
MGVAVSGWRLERAVSVAGQLGVVSGTALDEVLVRRLQLGDAGGHMRRALAEFPDGAASERILKRYFISGGKRPPRAGSEECGDFPVVILLSSRDGLCPKKAARMRESVPVVVLILRAGRGLFVGCADTDELNATNARQGGDRA